MTYIPYLGTFFFSRYPSEALARNIKYRSLAVFALGKMVAVFSISDRKLSEECTRSAHGLSEPFVGVALCSPRDDQSDYGLGSGGLAYAGTTHPCADAAPPCAGAGPPSAHSPTRLARREEWAAAAVQISLPMPGHSVRTSVSRRKRCSRPL